MFGTGAAAVETTETAAGCGCCPRCVVDAVVVDGCDEFEEPPFVEYGPADTAWLEADGDWSAEPARPVPEEIDILPPGRQLADLLEQIGDRATLGGAELVAVLSARARQLAHLQAELLADMVAVAGRCHPRISEPPPGAGRWAEPVDHGADEIAAALSWTSLAAGCQLEFAERLTRRLPAVYQAMLAGQIDYPKAKVFVDLLADIDPRVAAVVVDRVLPDAPDRTTAHLRRRIRRLVMAADPDTAARRYQEAVTRRRFEHGAEHDGTALLAGRWLPADRAAAAAARIRAIAD